MLGPSKEATVELLAILQMILCDLNTSFRFNP